jgi:hypothetical protein
MTALERAHRFGPDELRLSNPLLQHFRKMLRSARVGVMKESSPDQAQKIVQTLTDPSHPWMHDHIAFAHQTISELCGCSVQEANES